MVERLMYPTTWIMRNLGSSSMDHCIAYISPGKESPVNPSSLLSMIIFDGAEISRIFQVLGDKNSQSSPKISASTYSSTLWDSFFSAKFN